MTRANPQEQIVIKEGIAAGRDGSATLTLLAKAHEAAVRHNMTQTVRELRKHIYKLLPYQPEYKISKGLIFYTVVVGLITGVISAFVYKKTRLKERLGLSGH